ncbi:MAG: sugar transferase, partial [Erysipelotrichaceae bacterium]|nr:sugar transferase [Erysipelotrichaceae bacterium]
ICAVIDKFIHPDVEAGWTSTFAMMLFIGGFLMIFLGLIGEYVGRTYLIENHIPQYVTREEVRQEKKTKKE